MATRPREFDPFFYYHVYNCGVEKRSIFETDGDYQRFLDLISFYLYDQNLCYAEYRELSEQAKKNYHDRYPKGLDKLRIKLLAYCLMPNHFHFVLKQSQFDGITKFISDISNSHTRYFNLKNDRIGRLFQGTFKAKEVNNEPSLMQIVRYIHLNPCESKHTNPFGTLQPKDYAFSSYSEWLRILDPKGLVLVNRDEVSRWVHYMNGPTEYREFVESKVAMPGYSALGVEDLVIEEVVRYPT